MIATDATRGHNHRLRSQGKLTHHHARTLHPTLSCIRLQYLTMHTINRAITGGEFCDAVPEAQHDPTLLHARSYTTHKWLDHTRTSPPGDMKTGHRIAVPRCQIATALSPLHNGEDANTLPM